MKCGKLIVIEGTDCSGKETQSKILEARLKEDGYRCKRFCFPNYDSPTGKIIGGSYLGKPEIGKSLFKEGAVNVDPKVASLYYAADRKYNINTILEEGKDLDYIILDRYVFSNMAHQGSKILDKDERFNTYQWIDKLEFWLLGLPKPDITLFLHMPYKYTVELHKNRAYLDEHEKSKSHLCHAEACYLELSELYNWDKIECVSGGKIKSIEDISEEVYKAIISKK